MYRRQSLQIGGLTGGKLGEWVDGRVDGVAVASRWVCHYVFNNIIVLSIKPRDLRNTPIANAQSVVRSCRVVRNTLRQVVAGTRHPIWNHATYFEKRRVAVVCEVLYIVSRCFKMLTAAFTFNLSPGNVSTDW